MELMRFRWTACVTGIILGLLTAVKQVDGTRPEIVLAEVLTRPFVPREFASSECIRDSEIYLQALETYTPWALQMFDASVKIPSGVITGNYKQLGNFDECLRVKNKHGFVGQACTASVQFEINNTVSRRELDLGDLLANVAIASNVNWTSGNSVIYEWMFCVPSTCNHTEIQEALELALDPLKVEGRVDMTINVLKDRCHTVETIRTTWDVADWCYTAILTLLALVVVVSTGYDIAIQRQAITSEPRSIFIAFSLYKNGKELLRTDRRPGSIHCLDGLRFISICWIIYGHTYFMEATSVKMNLTHIPYMHYDWSNMLVLNGNIVTDTFFLLSGLLLAYNELSKKERAALKWRFDVIKLYIHRYVRLTPAYAMMIGFYATLFYKFGTGPQWDSVIGANKNYCRKNWWTNLLYVNNYVNVPDMCLSQSWYLSTDMQFLWLSPLILYPMFKFRTLFFCLIFTVFFLLSVLVPFVTTYSLQLTGTMLYYKEQDDLARVYLEIYIKTYNRFGSYIIGLFLGYWLHKTRSCKVKILPRYVILSWLIAIMMGFAVIFGPRSMYFDTYTYNRVMASLYASLHRQGFAILVSWIIFCCMHGYAGPINYLLSWRGWIPLSKLTYCAYLSHYLFILSHVGAVRTTGNLTQMNVLRAFFANLVFTMIISVLWSLCFEMPFMTIDSILFGRKQNLSKLNLKACDSTASGKEICQSKESSIMNAGDNNGECGCDVTHYDFMKIAQENCENSAGYSNDKAEKNVDQIYYINPVKRYETWSAINSNNKRSNFVNVDLSRIFDTHGQPKASNLNA